MLFYRETTLYAARKGNFKAHYIIEGAYGQFEVGNSSLINLSEDLGEKYDIADEHPEVLAEIKDMVDRHKQNLVKVKDQLAERETDESSIIQIN